MANRGVKKITSAAQVEHEIERCRELEYWAKVEHLAKQLKSNFDPDNALINFLIGEAKLEQYLQENPPLRSTGTTAAKNGLKEAKACLLLTVGDEAKKLGVHLDSFILLGKLNFAEANYKEALEYYEKAHIDTLEEKMLPPRSIKVMAEAFAIQAMCWEKVPSESSSKTRLAERENKIIRSYEISGDLTLLFLQVADSKRKEELRKAKSETMGQSTWSVASAGTTATGGSASPVPSDPTDNIKSPKERLGPILEAALYSCAKLNLKSGKVPKAISRWRSMLLAEESESTRDIRRAVCCQLAEALLHSWSDGDFKKPDPIEINTHSARNTGSTKIVPSSRFSNSSGESPWRPKRANSTGAYVPKNRYEEIVLCLILSEYFASKDAVLSQDPNSSMERKRTYEAAVMTYDLLALTLVRFNNFKFLSDVLERSMKFSFKQKHTWEQFALTLACENKLYRSLLVFQELASQFDDKDIDVGMFLSMSRLCYERLGLYAEGLELSKRALQSHSVQHSTAFSSRCNLYVGLGYFLVAKNIENQAERKDLLKKAEQHYKLALNLDRGDHVCHYHMGLFFAETRRPDEAMNAAQKAVRLNPEHLPSLQLTILLLSGKKQYKEALELADSVLEEYPDSLGLLTLKVRLCEVVHGGEMALNTAKDMLHQWQLAVEKVQAEEQMAEATMTIASNMSGGGGGIGGIASTPTVTNQYDKVLGTSSTEPVMGYGTIHSGMRMFDTMSDKDSISLHAHSMTASHIERTYSEVASSLSSQFPPRHGGSVDPSYSLMRIWLLCSELHLRQENLPEAESCIKEARNIMPMSYHLLYVCGLIHESKCEFEEARQYFENSLAINPSHVSSLFQLGKVYYQLGYTRLAEQTLKIAVRIDPVSEDLWSLLGLVTEALAQDFLTQGDIPIDTQTSCKSLDLSDSDTYTSDQDMDDNDRNGCFSSQQHHQFPADFLKVESEFTPTEETVDGFNAEAAKLFEMAAECQSIALSCTCCSAIVPFSTIPLAFE